MLPELAQALRIVGHSLLQWRQSPNVTGVWMGAQLKTDADLKAHDELSRQLTSIDASIPIISEEDAEQGACPERYWLIDPIDGTASFASGFPGFVTQAALIDKGRPEIAGVYAPVFNLEFIAARGSGSFCNGTRLRVSADSSFDRLIDNYPEPRGIAEAVFEQFWFKEYIESGSIALKICRIADGTADLFVKDVSVRDWDLAAADLVLSEAGGGLSDLSGNVPPYSGRGTWAGLIAAPSSSMIEKVRDWAAARTQ